MRSAIVRVSFPVLRLTIALHANFSDVPWNCNCSLLVAEFAIGSESVR
jgi:hypothetical protein